MLRRPQVDGGMEQPLSTSTLYDKKFYIGHMSKRPEAMIMETLREYRELVHRYSYRSLTNVSDKLPAFSSIAKSYARALNVGSQCYLAGLWKIGLPLDLLWYRQPGEQEASLSMISEPRMISWSWASLNGPIDYETQEHEDWGVCTLKILSCGVERKIRELRYGEVKHGFLKVQGYTRRAFWMIDYLQPCTIGGLTCDGIKPLPIQIFWDLEGTAAVIQNVWCLEVKAKGYSKSQGLVLTRDDESTTTFKRIGYFEFSLPQRPSKSQQELGPDGLSPPENWLHGEGISTVFLR